MYCEIHKDKKAVGYCVACGRMLCSMCLESSNKGRNLCTDCAVKKGLIKKNEKKQSSVPKERRKFVRINAKVSVSYMFYEDMMTAVKDLPEKGGISSSNLSMSGILFETDKAIPISSIIKLNINLPDTHEPVESLVRVLRVEEIMRDEKYEIGAAFVRISEESRAKLKHFIRK
ncbi:PilZ domain-containing protein [bacterium]|nr:PilZ domain-containing protein [bacterium]